MKIQILPESPLYLFRIHHILLFILHKCLNPKNYYIFVLFESRMYLYFWLFSYCLHLRKNLNCLFNNLWTWNFFCLDIFPPPPLLLLILIILFYQYILFNFTYPLSKWDDLICFLFDCELSNLHRNYHVSKSFALMCSNANFIMFPIYHHLYIHSNHLNYHNQYFLVSFNRQILPLLLKNLFLLIH